MLDMPYHGQACHEEKSILDFFLEGIHGGRGTQNQSPSMTAPRSYGTKAVSSGLTLYDHPGSEESQRALAAYYTERRLPMYFHAWRRSVGDFPWSQLVGLADWLGLGSSGDNILWTRGSGGLITSLSM